MKEGCFMKKILILMLTIAMLVINVVNVGAQDNEIQITNSTIYLNNQKMEFSTPTILFNDRTMVPMRELFEKLGADVEWYGDTQSITATTATKKITMQIDNYKVTANNLEMPIDAPPVLYLERTMVPLRFVSEQLNLQVEWKEESNSILLNQVGVTTFESFDINDQLSYEGEVINNLPHGMGKIIKKDTQSVFYHGNFKYGEFNGYGINNLDDGTCYSGYFSDGEPNGYGNCKWNNGTIYEGDWKNNKRNGLGIYIWPDTTFYVGDWVDDQRSGYGELLTVSGERYEGEWQNDKMNGTGVYYYEDGTYDKGEFVNGQLVNGRRYNQDGTFLNEGVNGNVGTSNNTSNNINTNNKITSITIYPNMGNKIVIKKGMSYTVNIAVTPFNADTSSLFWSSSNPSIVLVYPAIKTIQGLNEGTAVLNIRSNDGAYASCLVEVQGW